MSTQTDLSGLILAGGLSTRFGSDKALYVLEGKTLIEKAYKLLSAYFEEVYVSCREEQLIRNLDLPCLYDSVSSKGPISGIVSSRTQLQQGAFVLAVDYIEMQIELIKDLLLHRDPTRSATAYFHPDGVLEPLCTIYESSAFEKMEEYFDAGGGSLSQFLKTIDVQAVPLSPGQAWTNLNLPPYPK